MPERIKVVVTDYIEENLHWEAEKLAEAGIDFETYQLKFKSEVEILEKIADANIIVVNMVKLSESVISKLQNCKLIIRHGVGYDNVDVQACTKYGIQFAYQPDYCKEDVAEHAIALIFGCARKVVLGRKILERSSNKGKWDFEGLFPLYRMAGKNLGILGVGRIGGRVYLKLKNFGFKFLGCDPYLSNKRKAEMETIEWVDKETLFRESDYLTVHTPLNDETRNIVNAESLSWMKPTAYIINTSRGPMVNTAALLKALKEQKIAGAAIDVFDVEPPKPSLELFGLDNVVLTPHIAWASEEAGWQIRQSILDDVLAAAQGRDARCLVNDIKRKT